jgi:hypothetical protein
MTTVHDTGRAVGMRRFRRNNIPPALFMGRDRANREPEPHRGEHCDMNIFLAIAAILAWLFGGMLLLVPQDLYAPTGVSMTPMVATIAQAHGATLVGLGVVDWLARGADRRGITAVLAGNLVTQVLSLLVVFRTMQLGAGMAVFPGVVIHVVLGSLFAFFLVRVRRQPA